MTRLRSMVVTAVLLVVVVACSTYRSDLGRAETHYNANEYYEALALLEVLARDLDSLSTQEQARYAYYRGMTHYRLKQRREARYWLGLAAAINTEYPNTLAKASLERVTDTMADLNRDVYGTGTSEPVGPPCKTDAECPKGHFCDSGHCTAPPTPVGPPCKTDAECEDGHFCDSGHCTAPAGAATAVPTGAPTGAPTAAPTAAPTTAPTAAPTAAATATPTAPPAKTCTLHSDCPAAEVCRQGKCTSPVAAP